MSTKLTILIELGDEWQKRLYFWESSQYFIVHKTLPHLSEIILRQFWKILFLHFLAKETTMQSCNNQPQSTADLGSFYSVWFL